MLVFVPFARNVQFYEGVDSIVRSRKLPKLELHYQGRAPYEVLGSPVRFYRTPEIALTRFESYDQLAAQFKSDAQPLWLFHPRFELPAEAAAIAPHCEAVFRTLPAWLPKVDFGDWLKRVNAWTLFLCKPSQNS